MAHGSTQPLMASPRWRTALRRGVILGGITAMHLGSAALLLRPASPYRSLRAIAHVSESPLHIRVVISSTPSNRANSPSSRRGVPPPHHAAAVTSAPVAARLAAPVGAASLSTDITAGLDDYRSAALDVSRQNPAVHLPDPTASPRNGIRLRDKPSMRDVVRTMTTANRCKYEHMKMANSATQFVTHQLMERALYADGCGPQAERSAADSSVDAISRRVIFED